MERSKTTKIEEKPKQGCVKLQESVPNM